MSRWMPDCDTCVFNCNECFLQEENGVEYCLGYGPYDEDDFEQIEDNMEPYLNEEVWWAAIKSFHKLRSNYKNLKRDAVAHFQHQFPNVEKNEILYAVEQAIFCIFE